MHDGRIFQMSRDLLIGAVACLTAAFLLPLDFWRTLGDAGAALLILAVSALVTGMVLWRARSPGAAAGLAASIETAS
jgi:hypothetical protein